MDKVEEVLTRGVDQILPSKEELEKILRSGKKLRIYQGFDPTSPQLHIGHMIGLRKLRQWQELGHEVIFLIGDYTARIGDPTGKTETRPLLSKKQVDENAKTYKEQASKILRFEGVNPVKIRFNSEWLDKLLMPDIIKLTSQVTYQQVIKRGMFKKRLDKDEDISFYEIMYPIMQGYDSVAMDVDVEVGGRDQLFNMMMGRDLMHKIKQKNKFVMTTKLLEDANGNKIGKSEGNAIAFTDPPEKIYGAIMNFPDSSLSLCLECLTDLEPEKRKNPMEAKKQLAFEILKQIVGQPAAQKAQDEFENTFQKGAIPQDLPEISVKSTSIDIVNFLVENNLTESRSQAKRLLDQGALELDGQRIENNKIKVEDNQVLKIGKHKFVKIRISR